MCRKVIVSLIVFCFSVVGAFAHTVVYYNISGKPVNSVGKSLTSGSTATNIVKYNISGKPVSSVGKPLTYNAVNAVNYTISGTPISSVGQPMTSYVDSTVSAAEPVRIQRGQPKPSRIIVNRCEGITYYKKGVASCVR